MNTLSSRARQTYKVVPILQSKGSIYMKDKINGDGQLMNAWRAPLPKIIRRVTIRTLDRGSFYRTIRADEFTHEELLWAWLKNRCGLTNYEINTASISSWTVPT